MKKSGFKSYVYALAAVIAWGTSAPVCKAVMGNVSEEMLLFVSSLLAFLFLLILNIINLKKLKAEKYKFKDFGLMTLFGFIGIALYTYFYYAGIARLPSAEACTVNYLWPITVIVFSVPILKEKFTVKKAFAVILSFIGIIFVATQGEFSSLGSIDFSGILFCLAAAVCYGLFCVLSKKKQYDEILLLCIAYFTATVFSGIICAVNGTFSEIPRSGYIGVLWNGVIVSGAAYMLWAKGLNSGDTAKISNIAYLTPFLSILFGKILLDEDVTVWSFLGVILRISGIVFEIIKNPFTKNKKKNSRSL